MRQSHLITRLHPSFPHAVIGPIPIVGDPIDHAAQREGVLARFATLIDRRAEAPWTHMRIFEFADTAQRDRLQEGLGAIMSAMLPDGQARAQRAQRASALRDKVGEVDMDLLG